VLKDQARQTSPKSPLTREENNLCRYYHALFEEGDVPSPLAYAPYGDFADIATEMAQDRTRDGIVGLKQYVVTLGKIKDKRYKRLVTILSHAIPRQGEVGQRDLEQVGILLSEVKPQSVNWFWYPRLAFDKMSMLDGDLGSGKSNVSLDLVARVTNGSPMPDDTPGIARGAGVVMINPEDGLEDTTVPRLLRAGARLEKVSLFPCHIWLCHMWFRRMLSW
jgi:hypothetical protein